MNKKDNSIKVNFYLLGLILASLIVGALVYGHLPEKVPTHWNIHGEVDGYSGRLFGAFGFPLMTLGLYFFMILLPRIDPKKRNYVKFKRAYNVIIVGLVIFLLFMYAIILLAAFEYPIDIGKMVRLGIGILFIAMGNYMTQVRHNYFVGIRTPWTLADETVWKKTHRLGGILFVIAGILILLSIVLSDKIGYILTISSVLGVAIIAGVYSYFVYRFEVEEES